MNLSPSTIVSLRRCALAVALAAFSGLGSAASASVLDWILPKHDVQMIAVTDTTPAAALRPTPTPENPAYYIALNAGYHDFGGVMAGQDTPPTPAVLKSMATVLSKQGYLPMTKEHPPSLILIWAWGTMNTDRIPAFDPSLPDIQTNRAQLMRFLGGDKVGLIAKQAHFDEPPMPGTLFMTPDMQMIDELSSEDLYVVAIRAYDFQAFRRKQKVLLWTTKISCPSLGLSLTESLPTMLALAGPYIGRETQVPVSVRATDKYKPEVRIGDPKVVEYLEKTPVPVVDMTTAKPAKMRTGNGGK